ncbi:MAG: hypothetical protein KGI50_03615 [Patescibacteria group bacterium]|nr:hypothetical protein [Patescibacteria group bacterium]MDE2438379.1 hypothetical protein [Patescibacteria group bacterium]
MNEAARDYFHKHASTKEIEMRNAVRKIFTPRSEYRKGNIPLHYHEELPGGLVLDAQEKNGEAIITVEQYGFKKDLADFVAPGFRLVTPSFFKQPEHEKILFRDRDDIGSWHVAWSLDFLLIGDIRSPHDFFAFFHEAGHTFQKEKDSALLSELLDSLKKEANRESTISIMQTLSFLERDASASALKAMKRLRDEYRIDLFSLFHKDELRNLMYGALLDYRYDDEFEYRRILKEEGISEEELETVLRHAMKDLFDKGRFKE